MPKPKCQSDHNVGCLCCGEKFFIPNWFSKDDVEELIDQKITDKQFDKLVKSDILANEVSGLTIDAIETILEVLE